MFRIIHPNRWLIWTIALIVMAFIVVWGAVERYAIEQEYSYTGDEIFYSVRLHKKTSPSTIDTSGWKTYRSEKYGFEFKYPKQLTFYEQKTNHLILGDVNRPDEYVEIWIKVESSSEFQNRDCSRGCKKYSINDYSVYSDWRLGVISVWHDGKSYEFDVYSQELAESVISTLTFFEPKR